MSKREFLMLAHEYDGRDITNWWASEKLDGQRCFWDGGITTGLLKREVPWASSSNPEHIATGLWSRYGNVIHAPMAWIDQLPRCPLDGELWLGKENRNQLRSIVSRFEPTTDWKYVQYHVWQVVPYNRIFAPGKINNNHHKVEIGNIGQWILDRCLLTSVAYFAGGIFMDSLSIKLPHSSDIVRILPQTKLQSESHAYDLMAKIVATGGEGLVLRRPDSYWSPERSWDLLKMKPVNDAEGTVVGYTAGKGKYEGKMGALILDFKGKRLELSGMTDRERALDTTLALVPGQDASSEVVSPFFPRGTKITFKYRNLSPDGIPQEARYWRKSDAE